MSSTPVIDWQGLSAIGGFIATILSVKYGPKVVGKAKRQQRDALHSDIAYYEKLVSNLENANVRRDQMIEYLNGRLEKAVNRANSEHEKVKKLQDEIKHIEAEKEISIHHKQVIEQKIPGRGTPVDSPAT